MSDKTQLIDQSVESETFTVKANEASTKKVYDLGKVSNLNQITKYLVKAEISQDRTADFLQYSAIGAGYMIVDRGNTTPLKRLLEIVKTKHTTYKKILQYVTRLTGGMVTITEKGSGAKKEFTVSYSFDPAVKAELVAGLESENFKIEETLFYKIAQQPWFDEKVVKPKVDSFDLESWGKTFKKHVGKAVVAGISQDDMLPFLADGIKEAIEKQKTDLEKDAAKLEIKINALYSDAISKAVKAGNNMLVLELANLKESQKSGQLSDLDLVDKLENISSSLDELGKKDGKNEGQKKVVTPKKISDLRNSEAVTKFKDLVLSGVDRTTATTLVLNEYGENKETE